MGSNFALSKCSNVALLMLDQSFRPKEIQTRKSSYCLQDLVFLHPPTDLDIQSFHKSRPLELNFNCNFRKTSHSQRFAVQIILNPFRCFLLLNFILIYLTPNLLESHCMINLQNPILRRSSNLMKLVSFVLDAIKRCF